MNQNLEYYQHIKNLEEKIGFNFSNPMIYYQACTHRSYQNEMRNLNMNNERLEFLGDSVLSLVVSDFLYSNFPDFTEGELSFAKSKIIEAPACAAYAKELGIESFLLLGKGEMQNLGKGRDSVIADFFEAIIGAIFLDCGIAVARNFLIERFIKRWLDMGLKKEENEKVLLQEYSQKKFQMIPEYHVISEEGPDHDKKFVVSVSIQGKQFGEGFGSSKKQAQLNAAKAAIESLKSFEDI